jgi:hypothetical protein
MPYDVRLFWTADVQPSRLRWKWQDRRQRMGGFCKEEPVGTKEHVAPLLAVSRARSRSLYETSSLKTFTCVFLLHHAKFFLCHLLIVQGHHHGVPELCHAF